MYLLQTNTSSFAIVYLVLIIQIISGEVRDMKITMIVSNINILVYLVPPLPVFSNMFL